MIAILNFTDLAAPLLHKEEGSGMAPLLELFHWNTIKLAFSYACITLCGDMLITAKWAAYTMCSVLVCQVSTVMVRTCMQLQPQNLHIHVPQDFWGKVQLEQPFFFV